MMDYKLGPIFAGVGHLTSELCGCWGLGKKIMILIIMEKHLRALPMQMNVEITINCPHHFGQFNIVWCCLSLYEI